MGRGMHGVGLIFLLTPFLFFSHDVFSSVKEDPIEVSRKTLICNGVVHKVLFCPENGKLVETTLIGLIRSSKKITGALYLLTHKNIIEELIKAKRRGAEVNLIFDPGALSYAHIYTLADAGIPLKIWNEAKTQKGFSALMHLKSLIFWGAFSEERVIVASGSMNLTNNGLTRNHEQFTFCDNKEIVRDYDKHICALLENSRLQIQPVVLVDFKSGGEKVKKQEKVSGVSTKKTTGQITVCVTSAVVKNFSRYRKVAGRAMHRS